MRVPAIQTPMLRRGTQALLRRGLVAFSAVAAPRHDYYMLRHGESLANVAGVISSNPSVATVEHGLSEAGRAQAGLAAEQFCALARERRVAIFSSDFLRARETAAIVAARLVTDEGNTRVHTGGVILEERLRERCFGDFDGRGVEHYARVWEEDRADGTHTHFGCESVASVAERTSGLLAHIEESLPALPAGIGNGGIENGNANAENGDGNGDTSGNEPWLVLLVAHGDVLQILQTVALTLEPKLHRTIAHLGTAELRKIERPSALNEAYAEYIEYYDRQLDRGWKS
ncbi:histidine phosphatase superfamily [Pavlovales sp. CCMP2436]|nr:histidine phosphatase superfamily [Pavlovales sp. CCMP2436]